MLEPSQTHEERSGSCATVGDRYIMNVYSLRANGQLTCRLAESERAQRRALPLRNAQRQLREPVLRRSAGALHLAAVQQPLQLQTMKAMHRRRRRHPPLQRSQGRRGAYHSRGAAAALPLHLPLHQQQQRRRCGCYPQLRED